MWEFTQEKASVVNTQTRRTKRIFGLTSFGNHCGHGEVHFSGRLIICMPLVIPSRHIRWGLIGTGSFRCLCTYEEISK